MSIKESSDEMNPPVVTADALPKPRNRRSAKDYFALAFATCGVGYLPLAPGTWGSLVGVAIHLSIQLLFLRNVESFPEWGRFAILALAPGVIAVELVVIGTLILVGIWAASRTEQLAGRKDPGKVVIDEVAGQMIAMLPLIPGRTTSWLAVVVAFAFFRFFDIVKPYPARRLEQLESGLGVMSDDIVAGAYAAIVTAIIVAVIHSP